MKKFYVLIYSLLFLGIGASEAQFNVLYNFNDTVGENPWGNLIKVKNKLYGMAYQGGVHSVGCIFSIDSNGGAYKDLLDFDSVNGANPKGSLILSEKVLYGMTSAGGANNDGRIFSVDTNMTHYTDILDFSGANGNQPWGSLTLAGNKLYGMTSIGGVNSAGNVFSIDTDGTSYNDLLDFDTTNGASPYGSLLLVQNKLYGMTYRGGARDSGCIFSIDTNSGSSYTDLYDFSGSKGYGPHGDLTLAGNKLFGMTWIGGASDWGVVFSIDTSGGNTYKDLLDFNYTNGGQPQGNLTLSASGKELYGMTFDGGANHDGLIFRIDTNGVGYKKLLDFAGGAGTLPYGSLLLSGRNLYGMTSMGGTDTRGVIFNCDTAGSATSIDNLTTKNGSVNVYPNPSTGVFTLAFSHPELVSGSQTIKVYNILGEQVYSQAIVSSSSFIVNLSSLPAGIYLYRVMGNSSNLLGEGKLVIQK